MLHQTPPKCLFTYSVSVEISWSIKYILEQTTPLKQETEGDGGRRYNRRQTESKLNEEIKDTLARCVCRLLQLHLKTLSWATFLRLYTPDTPPSHVQDPEAEDQQHECRSGEFLWCVQVQPATSDNRHRKNFKTTLCFTQSADNMLNTNALVQRSELCLSNDKRKVPFKQENESKSESDSANLMRD